MPLFSAIKKLFKKQKSKSYYNSDHILTAKEKQILLISGFIAFFPLFIAAVFILAN